jgi:[acyl-carrier-protein] S-malonyltransferase
MSTAFIFPGQGAQFTGMGQDLYENSPAARAIYDRADEILGFKLSELCFTGPQEKLNATDIQQPAIFVMSIACLEAMRSSDKYQNVQPAYTAGLSLGEYTAYYVQEVWILLRPWNWWLQELNICNRQPRQAIAAWSQS